MLIDNAENSYGLLDSGYFTRKVNLTNGEPVSVVNFIVKEMCLQDYPALSDFQDEDLEIERQLSRNTGGVQNVAGE